jgi:hypothetical protein
MTMHFERELKSYAEPISSAQLKEGSIYFFVNFADSELLIPTIEPVVFAGRNFEPDDVGRVYFQDVYSYREGIRYDMPEPASEESSAEFHTGSEDELGHVFEYEQALDVLIACSLRRQKSIQQQT